MDIYRYFLIGAIAFCGLMLMTRWQAFNTVEIDQSAPVSAAVVPENNPAGVTAPIDEFAAAGTTPNESGLADIDASIPGSVIPDDETAQLNPGINQSVNNNAALISVVTDTLDLRIDSLGGDIVYVALPQHKSEMEKPDPFVLMNRNNSLTYVAQSGLIGPNATDTNSSRPIFKSTSSEYKLVENADSLDVTLTLASEPNVTIEKIYHFTRGSYAINIEYRINNQAATPWQAAFYALIKRDNSADPGSNSSGMQMASYLGFATKTSDEPYVKLDFDDIRDKPYKHIETGGWLSMVQHYFISAWIPPADQRTTYSSVVTGNGDNIMRLTSPLTSVAPGSSASIQSTFYAGPKDQYVLEELSPGLDLTVDYGWLWWIAQPLFWLLNWLHGFIGNWGWSIVALTFAIKLLFFQLSASSYKSMAKMRVVAPKLAELKERYGDDKQKYSEAMMAMYKKEKINPLGSCLPMLIQMPVFIALYWTLMESVELRHAPFMGWIQDLSAMDKFFVLPILMGASMWFMQKLNPPPPDPMQAKIFQWMPVVMTFLFLFFPAGLVLYWLTNNLLSMAQQWVITRQIEQAAAKA